MTDLDALLAGRAQHLVPAGAGQCALYRLGDAVASRNICAAIVDSPRLCVTR